MTDLEKVDACAKFLVIKLSIETNATEATYTLEGMTKGEERLGDYEVKIKKLK